MSNHQEVHKKYLSVRVSAQTQTFQSKREPRLPVEEKKKLFIIPFVYQGNLCLAYSKIFLEHKLFSPSTHFIVYCDLHKHYSFQNHSVFKKNILLSTYNKGDTGIY